MEELNRKIPQLPWIVAIVGIIIASYFFLSASKVNTKLNDRRCEMNSYKLKLDQFEKLEAVYGRASDKYYADKPLLILRTGGNEGSFTIFWDSSKQKDATAYWHRDDKTSDIGIKWEKAFENHLTNLIVTPGKKSGCYSITIDDNVSDDKFQVLVVVK